MQAICNYTHARTHARTHTRTRTHIYIIFNQVYLIAEVDKRRKPTKVIKVNKTIRSEANNIDLSHQILQEIKMNTWNQKVTITRQMHQSNMKNL